MALEDQDASIKAYLIEKIDDLIANAARPPQKLLAYEAGPNDRCSFTTVSFRLKDLAAKDFDKFVVIWVYRDYMRLVETGQAVTLLVRSDVTIDDDRAWVTFFWK